MQDFLCFYGIFCGKTRVRLCMWKIICTFAPDFILAYYAHERSATSSHRLTATRSLKRHVPPLSPRIEILGDPEKE
jgi:hypothetical protein